MALAGMSDGRKKASNAGPLAVLVLIGVGLGGCSWLPDYANPIEWYRDVSGVSKNDTKDASQRNQENLAAGDKAPYPNLSTVPPPPERAMSTVDREALQKGLAADRANAHYSDEQLREGNAVPPLPGTAPTQTADAGAAAGPQSAPAAASPQPAAAAPPSAAAVASQPAPTPSLAPPAAAPGGQAGAAGQAAAAAGTAHHTVPSKGSQLPPQETPLTSPGMRSLPQGETPEPPPPAPSGVQAPQQQAAVPVAPEPATAPPSAAAVPPAPSELPAVMRGPQGRRPSVTLEAADIAFTRDGKTLSAEDNQHLAEIARLQKREGGSVRIVGLGRRGYGTDAAREELQSFGDALDRANAVAQALTKLGVPANRITVQAAPQEIAGGDGAGLAEVLLEY